MNLLDLAVIAVLLVSGLLAFARGFVREVLSVAGWVAAAFGAIAAFPHLSPRLREWIGEDWVADVVAAASVFIVVLIVVSVISGMIAERIHETRFKGTDRTLGFLFGLVRGAVLICLAYLLATWVLEPDQHPDWLMEAKSRPIVARGAVALARLVPEDMQRDLPLDRQPELPELKLDPGDILTIPPSSKPSQEEPQSGDASTGQGDTGSGGASQGQGGGADGGDGPGYSPEQREELDELFEQQTE